MENTFGGKNKYFRKNFGLFLDGIYLTLISN